MALMPDNLRLTEDEQLVLDEIHAKSEIRHEKARKAALRKGRKDFPIFPRECSWAFEQEFRRNHRAGWKYNPDTRNWNTGRR